MNVRRATRADAPAVASIHLEAFKGQLSSMVGRHYAEALIRWFSNEPTAIALVAEEDGRVLGYVFGAPDGYSVKMNRQLAPWIAAGVVRHAIDIVRHPSFRRQVVSRFNSLVLGRNPPDQFTAATPSGTFCLVGIGTAASARRRGVGAQLIAEFCHLAKPRPVILDVLTQNAPAISAYSKAGFQVLAADEQVRRMIRRELS